MNEREGPTPIRCLFKLNRYHVITSPPQPSRHPCMRSQAKAKNKSRLISHPYHQRRATQHLLQLLDTKQSSWRVPCPSRPPLRPSPLPTIVPSRSFSLEEVIRQPPHHPLSPCQNKSRSHEHTRGPPRIAKNSQTIQTRGARRRYGKQKGTGSAWVCRAGEGSRPGARHGQGNTHIRG